MTCGPLLPRSIISVRTIIEALGAAVIVALVVLCALFATSGNVTEPPLTAADVTASIRQNVEANDLTLDYLNVDSIDGDTAIVRVKIGYYMPKAERRQVTFSRAWHVIDVKTLPADATAATSPGPG